MSGIFFGKKTREIVQNKIKNWPPWGQNFQGYILCIFSQLKVLFWILTIKKITRFANRDILWLWKSISHMQKITPWFDLIFLCEIDLGFFFNFIELCVAIVSHVFKVNVKLLPHLNIYKTIVEIWKSSDFSKNLSDFELWHDRKQLYIFKY